MPPDLFSNQDEARRIELRNLGWMDSTHCTLIVWRRPDGVGVTEEEAFRQLAAGRAEYPEPRVG